MAKSPVTIRELAALLRLSRATISSALRGTGRVSPLTQQRVQEAARRTGYRHNPLAATLMSELRRSRGGTFRGVIGAIELLEPDRPGGHGPFHRELVHGARERCAELGFKLELFAVDHSQLPLTRLDRILHSRGIHGLLLLPSWHTPNFSQLSWDRYAGVYTDYNLVEPHLHSVCSDPYGLMMLALNRLHAHGYRRPGLYIEDVRNERLHRRHTAAYRAFYPQPARGGRVPPLVTPTLSQPAFERWFKRFRPDVVLCHFPRAQEWMEALGARVPGTHGFVCLNSLHRTRLAAALDLQPRIIGAHGIDLITAQLNRNERGVPASPARTTIAPRWVDGPTVRPIGASLPASEPMQMEPAVDVEDCSG